VENLNPKVDAYIAKSGDFAKPILKYFRKFVHDTCPEVVEEVKWGMPFFSYKGDIMCHMASFKQHCAIGFWKAKLMKDASLMENAQSESSMGHLGKITRLEDLTENAKLTEYIQEAMALNEKGLKVAKPKPEKQVELDLPADFKEKLSANPLAIEYFESKSPSFRKEYIMWITDAKSETTRQTRIEQAVEWISDGKSRLWKYEKAK
jgi:uncharacterized protein YdeI (YjbR/CyaY-like superfamily)